MASTRHQDYLTNNMKDDESALVSEAFAGLSAFSGNLHEEANPCRM